MSPRAQSGLWGRIVKLLRTEVPMTTRQLAERLDADLDSVRRLLMIYADRGRAIRVIYPDHKHLHWRLAERDPRRDPRPGDALRSARVTRRVTHIQFTPCGALDKVHSSTCEVWSATEWREWAKQGVRVIERGEP